MDRAAKDALYDALAAVARALGNGRRAELVDLLSQGERHVEELALQAGQSVANTSQHLQVLRRAALVRTRRDGTRVVYALADPAVGTAWRELRNLAADRVPDVEERALAYLGERRGLAVIDRDELLSGRRAGRRPRRAPGAGVPRRPPAGRAARPAGRAGDAAGDAAGDGGDRRVLPGPVLRLRGPGRPAADGGGAGRTANGRRVPGVGCGGAPGRHRLSCPRRTSRPREDVAVRVGRGHHDEYGDA